MDSGDKKELTESEKGRINRNRQKAIFLRESKVKGFGPSSAISCETADGGKVIQINGSKFVDTNCGFLLDPADIAEDEDERAEKILKLDDAMEVPLKYSECLECEEEFTDSYLLKNFNYSVCDKCKDHEEKHILITKTDAKNEYLLKDCDFDRREPPLKFICRKNPHGAKYHEMKLYLHLQVKARALVVWEDRAKIEEARKEREEKKEVMKVKKYNKQLTSLRMNVRSTLYDRTTKKHVHEFGESVFNEEEDNYTKVCKTCEYSETYEEL
ncbi:unnamed protein product [Diamesa tonsa]